MKHNKWLRFSVNLLIPLAIVGLVFVSYQFISVSLKRASLQSAISLAALAGVVNDEPDPEKRRLQTCELIRNVLVVKASGCSSLGTTPIPLGSQKVVIASGLATQYEYKFEGNNQTLDVKVCCNDNGTIMSDESSLSFTDSSLNVKADSGLTNLHLVEVVLDRSIKVDSGLTNFMSYWAPNQDSVGIISYANKAQVNMRMSIKFADDFKQLALTDFTDSSPLSPDEGMRSALDEMKKDRSFSAPNSQKMLILETSGRWAPGTAERLSDISTEAREEGVTIYAIAQGANVTPEECQTLKMVANINNQTTSRGEMQPIGVFLQGTTDKDLKQNLCTVAACCTGYIGQ